MEVKFTGVARAQLLEEVALSRNRDRSQAADLVKRTAETLEELARGEQEGRELRLSDDLGEAVEGHRFFYRVRGKTLWLLAMWPEEEGGLK